MKRYTFSAPGQDPQHPSQVAFLMLWEAFIHPGPGVTLGADKDGAREAAAEELETKLRELTVPAGDGNIKLHPIGGELLLEDAAHLMLLEHWEARRPMFAPAQRKLRKAADDFLDTVETVAVQVTPKDEPAEESVEPAAQE